MTRTNKLLLALLLVVALMAAGWWVFGRGDDARLSVAAVSGTRPTISAPRPEAIPTVGIADAVGWQGDARPTPAPGLAVNAFAAGLDHPRSLLQLPNGDVLVAETNSPPREGGGFTGWVTRRLLAKAGADVPSANRITLLRDTNGDGVADVKVPFLTGLSSPYGMALVGDRLYVANHDALVWYPYTAGTTRITAAPVKALDLPGGGNHWTKNIAASPDGRSIFIAVGSTSNIAENGMEVERNRANILEYDRQRGTVRVFTSGLRNPVGLAWEPRSGALWTSVNERDMLGSDLAPDYLARVDFGAFFGWPYSYWGGYQDPRVEKRPDLLQYTRRPDYALGPHTASLGLAFGSLGPFRDGAFVGQHGSWNRHPPSGYKVVFVPFNARGFPSGAMADVLTGFLDAKGRAQGRPVSVIARREGDLLVADDVGNRVWRVAAAR